MNESTTIYGTNPAHRLQSLPSHWTDAEYVLYSAGVLEDVPEADGLRAELLKLARKLGERELERAEEQNYERRAG